MSTGTAVRTEFATHVYDHLARTLSAKGLVLSPFSIQVALAMCAAGAKGETRRVLAELIGAPADNADQNRQYAELLKSVGTRNSQEVQLLVANALWVEKSFSLRPEYQKTVADCYGGTCNVADFRGAPEQALGSINTWVEGKTAGRIKELIKRQHINADTRLILTNAIYFKGKWANQFDKTHTWDEDWHGSSGVRSVPMMHKRGGYHYHEHADFQALDIPYQGEQLSLLVILPRQNDGLSALEGKWASSQVYEQATGALAFEDELIVSLPRFKVEAEFSLKDALIAMGAGMAFSDQADFSGISAEPLKISDVLHKAFIEVNEEGAEAAAATGAIMAKCVSVTEPKSFIADHPFLYVIRDRATNAILFCGRVLEPESGPRNAV